MFGKKNNDAPDTFDTLIGIKTTFTGNIECEGTIRVDGTVKGNLTVNGDIFIGNNGHITGNINASNIFLSGMVEGNIHANGILRLLSTSKLYGDIHVHGFVTDEGAQFQGKCNMRDMAEPEKAKEKSDAKRRENKEGSASSAAEGEK